ncbi:hypothetical protein OIU78_007120 [Salix suchowensis]|nr:hypothetical protein OIU78_007120 [Salix suchowensis]
MEVHAHCFALVTRGLDFRHEAYFMTDVYLEMMWRRIDFLRSLLELGYNFVFTDADIMWFRDPFPRLVFWMLISRLRAISSQATPATCRTDPMEALTM